MNKTNKSEACLEIEKINSDDVIKNTQGLVTRKGECYSKESN